MGFDKPFVRRLRVNQQSDSLFLLCSRFLPIEQIRKNTRFALSTWVDLLDEVFPF